MQRTRSSGCPATASTASWRRSGNAATQSGSCKCGTKKPLRSWYRCELQPIDFAAFARACGAAGISVEDPHQCGAVLDRAFATPGPVIVEATVDRFEPPMPPKITVDQATKFAEALAKRQPHRNKIALTVLADKVRELV
jgi:hypothetical protein